MRSKNCLKMQSHTTFLSMVSVEN